MGNSSLVTPPCYLFSLVCLCLGTAINAGMQSTYAIEQTCFFFKFIKYILKVW